MSMATALTMAGYKVAASSLARRVCCCSKSSAKRSSTSPKWPLCSPAATTERYTGGNSLGCSPKAWAKVDPALTSARKAATKWCWRGCSASSAKALKARSSGRPAPTKPASWRVQVVSSLRLSAALCQPLCWAVGLLPAPKADRFSGTKACARNWLRAARAESASTTPLWVAPWASRA